MRKGPLGCAARSAGAKQLEANQRQQVLLDQQLQGMRTLTAKGFAAPNSIRALERTSADLTGAQRQYAASISGLQHQVAETQLQSANLDLQRRQLAATSLHDTDDALNALKPKLDAVRQQLERSTLRAPTDGVVTGLTVFSAGAVAAPGQQLMEIVPTHPALTVRARLAASEIEGVHPGQKAEVHFLLSGVRGIPVLSGALTQLSADSFTDQRSGQSFYTAEVTVPKSQLDLIRRVPGADSALRPGVPVQIMIALHKRTAFEYLFEPLYQSIWGAFRQR
jgi:HlyD family type I secretion membrane fusion protein